MLIIAIINLEIVLLVILRLLVIILLLNICQPKFNTTVANGVAIIMSSNNSYDNKLNYLSMYSLNLKNHLNQMILNLPRTTPSNQADELKRNIDNFKSSVYNLNFFMTHKVGEETKMSCLIKTKNENLFSNVRNDIVNALSSLFGVLKLNNQIPPEISNDIPKQREIIKQAINSLQTNNMLQLHHKKPFNDFLLRLITLDPKGGWATIQ